MYIHVRGPRARALGPGPNIAEGSKYAGSLKTRTKFVRTHAYPCMWARAQALDPGPGPPPNIAESSKKVSSALGTSGPAHKFIYTSRYPCISIHVSHGPGPGPLAWAGTPS